ncbi:MAG: alpha/beta hydrolase [Gammaproteobacteria bacterium]|nr:alpha/beta hydrolase [Gammaproteobacteria bacterium]
MYTTHFITNGEIQTAYHDVGSGSPFVFVHGFTGSKLDFRDQLEWFEDARRLIAFDQRGHGESSNMGPYDFKQLVTDLLGFLDQLEIERCDILGHSLGGMVVMRAVIQHPARFRSMILMDTTAEHIEMWSDDVRAQLGGLVEEEGCQALLPMMRSQPVNKAQQRGVDYLGEEEHWRRIGIKLAQMDPEAFAAFGAELSKFESRLKALKTIRCPTTVLVGAKDAPFLNPSRHMAATIRNARLVTIPLAAHCPQYENAEVWRDSIRAHLAESA